MSPSPPLSEDCLYDAHCHPAGAVPQDVRAVLNGTSPADWPAILEAAGNQACVLPAVGLHPWQVDRAADDWQRHFLTGFDSGGVRVVGEIGLDRHFAIDSFEAQCAAFTWQLDQAAERNLPVSIHCLKATSQMLHLLKSRRLPARGFHLHAFSGSAEEAAQFCDLGAYLSFHASQLSPPARKAPDALRRIPLDRVLIESDAPDTLPESINQRDYLRLAYERAAAIRNLPLSALTEGVLNNFHRYFLDD